VLDAEPAPTIDVTAIHMLAELIRSLERDGVRLLVTRQIGQVRDVVGQVATDTTPEGVYPRFKPPSWPPSAPRTPPAWTHRAAATTLADHGFRPTSVWIAPVSMVRPW
jgi:hypothetical protein